MDTSRHDMTSAGLYPSGRGEPERSGAGCPGEVEVLGVGIAVLVEPDLVERGELAVVAGHDLVRRERRRSRS